MVFCADSSSTVLHLSLLVVAAGAGESRALHLDHKNECRRASKQFCACIYHSTPQGPKDQNYPSGLWLCDILVASWWLCVSFLSLFFGWACDVCEVLCEVQRCAWRVLLRALGRWSSEPWISRLDPIGQITGTQVSLFRDWPWFGRFNLWWRLDVLGSLLCPSRIKLGSKCHIKFFPFMV